MVGPNALIASAQVLTGARHQDPAHQRRAWQDDVWMFYDEAGPLRYATNWLASLASRARLQAAVLPEGGDEPSPIDQGTAADAVSELAGGINGQSQMLRSCAVDLTVPGVGYLVGKGKQAPTWRMYSADVLRMRHPATPGADAVYELLGSDGQTWQKLEPDSLVVKVWRPHERYYWEPDSPARAALGDLRELHRIRQYIDATLVSRLAGAGVVIIPKEATFPTAPGGDDPAELDGQPRSHPFVTELMEVMMSAVKKPGTPSQIVPYPVVLPAEYAQAFRHIRFETELSEQILEMRESALRMCAITLDVPAEVLTGMGSANHWGAWAIEESAVKVHAEPLLELITAALTKGYLHPILRTMGMGEDEVQSYVMWADTSELSAKPDKSDDAMSLLDRGDLSPDAARRETGLSEADAPSDEQFERWAWKQLLKSDTHAPMALEALGIKLPEMPTPVAPVSSNGAVPPGQEQDEEADGGEEGEESAQEGPPDTRGNEAPSQQADLAHILVLEQFVYRALERAGNRLRNKHKAEASIQDCDAALVHTCLGGTGSTDSDARDLLKGAWPRLAETAADMGLDAVLTVQCLSDYCAVLLEQGWAYERGSFEKALAALFRAVAV